ncbi:Fatty acid hydroxylase superfamily protein [Bradyrhizobium sp. Rc2d]|uniref:sterol desaturase family protein n=1 Tax=Bradyrhizobium sp. Rc2d TaxID=1855321 RepID=UPI00087DFD20|nr:sterol desaturase family protein [Bradyrhizobium sp. Rc2d]SDJ80085.1 Fatty acid hydroxylase superfamily protein [Bradyrhizobium sp. Rc2d]
MELQAEAMTQRQLRYRATYRERVSGWYNGWLHVFVIYTIGFVSLYVYASNLSNVVWWEYLIVPLTFVGANFFEWAIHRYVMHRPSPVKALRAIYNRHTLMHHQFFTEEEMRFADHHDWRVTFFPPYALVVFTLMSIPGALVAGLLLSPNIGWLFISTTTAVYLTYEFMHFCCHVDENWFVRNMPMVNTIRRHHAAHHNHSLMMEKNMNLTVPIMDWAFGTSDLDRGLLGHIFNGYSTRHLKKNLRKTSRTPKIANASVSAGSETNLA